MACLSSSLSIAFLLIGAATNVVQAAACSSSAITTPSLSGISILSRSAVKVNNPSFCNVTITYTHPGENDIIHVGIGLPDTWNGRFQGIGGGGWLAGLTATALFPAVESGELGSAMPKHVNVALLEDFASVALRDMTLLGKQVTESYFRKKIFKPYWNGCSTGGRQGHMLAQKNPTLYDGIRPGSPAINKAAKAIGAGGGEHHVVDY